jgi:hypothetical protein
MAFHRRRQSTGSRSVGGPGKRRLHAAHQLGAVAGIVAFAACFSVTPAGDPGVTSLGNGVYTGELENAREPLSATDQLPSPVRAIASVQSARPEAIGETRQAARSNSSRTIDLTPHAQPGVNAVYTMRGWVGSTESPAVDRVATRAGRVGRTASASTDAARAGPGRVGTPSARLRDRRSRASSPGQPAVETSFTSGWRRPARPPRFESPHVTLQGLGGWRTGTGGYRCRIRGRSHPPTPPRFTSQSRPSSWARSRVPSRCCRRRLV